MGKTNSSLTQDRLRELLRYDPATGIFEWWASGKGRKMGKPAGCTSKVGYTVIRVDGELFQAHRLAWFYVRGWWPPEDIDHKNGVRVDNSFENLRDATRGQNLQNSTKAHPNNKHSGVLGVTWHGQTGKWWARVALNGKQHSAGLHDTIEEAQQAYLELKRDLHPFCTI